MMRREAKLLRLKRPKFISLPNILLEREIVPELAEMEGIRPEQVRAWLDRLLYDAGTREKQLEDFEELDTLLGPDDAITQTAILTTSIVPVKPS
jgi:lipid A disaccharide synthetase